MWTSGLVDFNEISENCFWWSSRRRGIRNGWLKGSHGCLTEIYLPWKELDVLTPPSSTDFSKAQFWVQIHDLTLICMHGTKRWPPNRINGGGMVEVGKYLRIKINLDLEKQLARGRTLQVKG